MAVRLTLAVVVAFGAAALAACSGRSGYVPTSTSPQNDVGDDDDDDDDAVTTRDAATASDASDVADADLRLDGGGSSSSSSASSSGVPADGGSSGTSGPQTGLPEHSSS